MCLVGGIHFSGASGNSARASSACASSSRKLSSRSGSISNACPRPSCQSSRPASLARVSLSSWLTVTVCASSTRSEEHTSELQSLTNLVCRLLLEKKKKHNNKKQNKI